MAIILTLFDILNNQLSMAKSIDL